MLIASQKPLATHVAGFHAWHKLGRFVKNGEKGIVILAPIVRRKNESTKQDETDESSAAVGFRAAYVFDITQTDGQELPTIGSVNGDPREYRERLATFVAEQGIALEYSEDIAPARGTSAGGKITVMPGQSPAEEFATLAHELAHEMMHRDERRNSRALSKAQEALTTAEQSMISVQKRQERLQERAVQFKKLHQRLETSQNDTAELVLSSIRRPVQTLFQAMTAGCPWQIEFRLEDGKVSPVLADGTTHDVAATSVLNSAYVNVAAIALRLALASQQKWTRLRTVILDDPILEMDLLTQSALIDGLEAVLVSNYAPWSDLQFVLTTWSEDFAVMAAHKLAHLNHGDSERATARGTPIEDEFVIHQLSLQPDGAITAQRHVPRWQAEASAA